MSRWIDAEWLLNFFEPYPNDYQTPLGSLRACVDDAPSIDIEPKHGEWIDNRGVSDKSQLFPFECSECHDDNERTTNFCPNCGADMRERKDERDYL